MLDKMTGGLGFHSDALVLRAERQRVISSNIANADTPGYVARDFDFAQTLRSATGQTSQLVQQQRAGSVSHAGHIPLPAAKTGHNQDARLGYSIASQPALDNNTVDLDRERANFVDNAVRYEATLRFLNGQSKTMLSAITGQ
ncbi:flagellar basal body rod protein FlgB [Comamonas sp. GB3 AK4-5]|jgi:flagellar basal-body rod protein FlgB|uniref:flagellar basal body rod protein FlgB n=1 Tax=Comamonas sp. GB3 AK4-5 TaxID=3231487 RepID=UPI0028287384|nr:flagellar basal body rod protein FlgB [Acidovorax sp.]MDR3004359.1 flagellar basal body rod protein FlgB [Acidovorax sp.]